MMDGQYARGGPEAKLSANILGSGPDAHPPPQSNSNNKTPINPSDRITSTSTSDHSNPYNLASSPKNGQVRKTVLGEAVFPDWKDNATNADLDDPAEMQKKDPLGTQIWKLYSKAKSQLPNQERMENLTWRMMAMKLKHKEQERARFVALTVAFEPSDACAFLRH